MKRILAAAILAVLLVMSAGFFPAKAPLRKLTATVRADVGGPCSLATVAGNWGATLTGALLLPTGPVPAAAVLRARVDAEGNVTGTEARNLGGGYAEETLSGNWIVNADCTGTATVSFYEAGQLARVSVVTIVFDENSKEVRMVQKSLTLPDGTELPVVVTVEGKKI